jgi:hypothetical protein
MPDVRQVQFVQRRIGEVLLKVVPGKGYTTDTVSKLRERLAHYFDSPTHLTIEEVAQIPSEISGKYRFVVSELGALSPEDQHVAP